MSRVSRPTQKVIVFDPITNTMREADTTDQVEMARRAQKAIDDAKLVKKKKKK